MAVIDSLEFARTGQALSGSLPLAEMLRLKDSLHAAVGVSARDRRRLERLIHYVARPGSIAPNQLHLSECLLSDLAENAVYSSFHRVGVQDVLPPSPQILRSGRLLSFWLGGLELRFRARGSARAAAEPLRVARSDDSVRGQSRRIAIRWRVCSPRRRGNHPSIWASSGHRFVGFFGGA